MPQGGVDKKIYILGGLIVLFVVALILFLVFGRKHTTPTTSSSGSSQLVIWDSFDEEENLAPYIVKFKDRNPDISVSYVKKNPANFELESIDAIAAGNGPDVWVIPSNWMAKHNSKLAALTDWKLDSKKKKTNSQVFREDYLAVAAQDSIFSDQVLGMPLFIDSLSLYYNSSLLNKKFQDYIKDNPNADPANLSKILTTPPKTWDDLASMIKYYGDGAIALGSSNVEHSSDILVALMIQSGAQMASSDNKNALFHTAKNLTGDVAYPGTKALDFYTTFAKKGDPHYTWDKAEKSAYESFTKEKAAMMIDYKQNMSKVKRDLQYEPGISALPQIKDTTKPLDLAYYQIFTVPKASQNQEKAWDFILSLSNSEVLPTYLNKVGVNSALKNQTEGSTDWADIQNKIATSWYNPDPYKVDKILKTAIDQVLDGQRPQTAIDGAAAEVTSLLGKLTEEQ